MIIAVIAAVFFHLIPVPADVASGMQPTFQLQGYTEDATAQHARTVTELPGYTPETDTLRPSVLVSFVAPTTGACIVAYTETIDGTTSFLPIGEVDVVAGKRAYEQAALPDYDDLDGDVRQAWVRERYRIVVGCQHSDDDPFVFSQFYEVAVPKHT